jgi:hypothetical protein
VELGQVRGDDGREVEDRSVMDSRFTTVADGIDDMLNLVEIDELGDIETLMMFLFDRPVGLDQVWDDEGVSVALDVSVPGDDESIGSVYEFPFSVMALVRSCADTVADLGPYTHDGASASSEAQDVLSMSDAELITALQQGLGKVRIFNLMDADE